MSMSQKIKEAIAVRGLTQADIAAAIGMQPTLLARMLRNDDHNYTVKTLSRIAAAIGVDLSIEFGPSEWHVAGTKIVYTSGSRT